MNLDAHLEDAPNDLSKGFVAATIKHYRTLVLRAVEIANLLRSKKTRFPYDEDDIRNLEWDVEGDGKTVFIAFNSKYDEEHIRFPREYLWYSDESIRITEAALRAAEEARRIALLEQKEREKAEHQAAAAARKETEERALYEKLKAKFEQKGA